METIVKGNRYNYKILNTHLDKKNSLFSIKAIHKQSRRSSYITTVNIVLSNLNVNSEEPRFWESDWIVNKKEAKKLIKDAKELFSDNKYLPFVENYLNFDRKESEWGNHGQL
ncbi:MAG: hypothetical protein HY919_03875 [Elusimicrobia bacterium]|nr:hypothetical protein [Elusimicrobiota bacterium]